MTQVLGSCWDAPIRWVAVGHHQMHIWTCGSKAVPVPPLVAAATQFNHHPRTQPPPPTHSSSSSCFRGPGFYSSDCIPYSFTIYKLLTIGIVAQFAFQFAIIIFSDSQIERMKIKLRINYKGNKKKHSTYSGQSRECQDQNTHGGRGAGWGEWERPICIARRHTHSWWAIVISQSPPATQFYLGYLCICMCI